MHYLPGPKKNTAINKGRDTDTYNETSELALKANSNLGMLLCCYSTFMTHFFPVPPQRYCMMDPTVSSDLCSDLGDSSSKKGSDTHTHTNKLLIPQPRNTPKFKRTDPWTFNTSNFFPLPLV